MVGAYVLARVGGDTAIAQPTLFSLLQFLQNFTWYKKIKDLLSYFFNQWIIVMLRGDEPS